MQNENCVFITGFQNLAQCDGQSCAMVLGNSVEVWIDGACVESQRVPCTERYDREQMNAYGRPGKVISEPNTHKLNTIAQEFSEKYKLPIHDGSQTSRVN
jgi:hypothetical protein